MRNLVSILLFCLFTTLVYAQNKSLGVGTAAPNPNAALHVESPTSNQGFIMPRLTSAQRTAPGFQGVLSAVDVGLMVYDTDLKGIYVWDGAAWGGAAKLITPYKDSTSVGPKGGNLFDLRYNGPDTVGLYAGTNYNPNNPFAIYFGVNAGGRAYYGQTSGSTHAAATFRVLNGASTRPAVEGVTNSNTAASSGVYGGATGTGANAGYFQIINAANNKAALVGETNGLGHAGRFSTTNATNTAHALFAQSNADTLGAAIHGNNIGNGFGVFGKSAGTKFASAAVYGEHVGTGDAAGAFRINNVGNTYSALYGETNGSGSAIFGNQLGTGRAGQFQIDNATSTSAALRGFTNGLGYAGFFTINNTSSTVSSVFGETNGALTSAGVYGLNTGNGFGVVGRSNGSALGSAAVYGEQLGTGDAAGAFRISNAANTSNAVYGETNGTASAINANQLGTGRGMIAQINNAGNSQTAFFAQTNGTGAAGNFTINNALSTANALDAITNGPGNAIAAINTGTGFGVYARATGATDAVYAIKQGGDGAGSAGNFQNQNSSNGASTLFAMTNAEPGTAIGAINSANGNAFAIFQGGLRVSTHTLPGGGGIIATRATAYLVNDASSPYTFSGGITLNEGDTFYVYNNDGGNNASIDGLTIAANTGALLIYIGGALRSIYGAPGP